MLTSDLKLFIGLRTLSIVEAMEKIDKNARGILFIVDSNNSIVGCVSDGDIRRWLIRTGDLSASVEEVMTKTPNILYEEERDKSAILMNQENITAIPIVDQRKVIVDIELLSSIDKDICRQDDLGDVTVVIMAGGRGERLYPYTKILPKPLIPIREIPIVERIIDAFRDYGVVQFYMTLNYKKGMIKSYFQEIDPDYKVCYVEENKPLGTAGSIKLIQSKPKSPFFVTNCDILIVADYIDIYDYHIKTGNDITIVSALKNVTIPYGVINTGDHGELLAIKEKPRNSYLINTGMYILNPDIIEIIPDDREFHMTELIDDVIKKGGKVGMYPISEESFLDMGEFSEMKRMEDKLSAIV